MKASKQHIQTLPNNTLKTSTSWVDHNLPDLHEEIYNHPQEFGSKNRNLDYVEEYQYESDRSTESRTLPLPIPFDGLSKEAEREEELRQDLIHLYNDATWKMYHRIQNARKARYIEQRNRSRSLRYR